VPVVLHLLVFGQVEEDVAPERLGKVSSANLQLLWRISAAVKFRSTGFKSIYCLQGHRRQGQRDHDGRHSEAVPHEAAQEGAGGVRGCWFEVTTLAM